MSNLPDFTKHNYQINKQLGYNTQGGRITYLATHLESQQEVVIKEYLKCCICKKY